MLARPTTSLIRTLNTLATALALGAACVLGANYLTTSRQVRRSLQPLSELTSMITARGDRDAIQQIPIPPSLPVELRPLVDSFNKLLLRVDALTGWEREFASNAAHELRTPIAGLHAVLEVAARKERTADDYRERLGTAVAVSNNVRALLDSLMRLARLRNDREPVLAEELPLAAFLSDTWTCFAERAAAASLDVVWDLPADEASATTDPGLVHIIVRNLFDNAVEYAPEGTPITIGLSTGAGAHTISVGNFSQGLTAETSDLLFEPFFRSGISGRSATRHSGIGLSLSQHIAQALGATLGVRVDGHDYVRIFLRLPAKPY